MLRYFVIFYVWLYSTAFRCLVTNEPRPLVPPHPPSLLSLHVPLKPPTTDKSVRIDTTI